VMGWTPPQTASMCQAGADDDIERITTTHPRAALL
jgi:hypothetical protein